MPLKASLAQVSWVFDMFSITRYWQAKAMLPGGKADSGTKWFWQFWGSEVSPMRFLQLFQKGTSNQKNRALQDLLLFSR